MSVYKVGIMSTVRLVNAPSALAAALFYGFHTSGNGQCAAVVYEQDGKRYDGPSPWLAWQFGQAQPTEAEIEQLKRELPVCRFAKEAPDAQRG